MAVAPALSRPVADLGSAAVSATVADHLDGRGQGLEAEMTRTDANRAVGGSGGLAAAGLAGSYGGSRANSIETGR